MFFFENGHAAVLLLALTQKNLVFASFEYEKIETRAVAKMILSFLPVPWIGEFDAVISDPESSCVTEFAALTEAIKSKEMWALQMLDASSKIQSGILQGNVRNLGMYNECVQVNGQYNDTKIRGKYCTISNNTGSQESTVMSSASRSFSSALCVPSSCNETQIDRIINAVLQNSLENISLANTASKTSCIQIGSEDFTMGEILSIVFFSTVGAFMVFCTICDFVKRNRPEDASVTVQELAKFSLYTNAIALLSTKLTPHTMPAIQGIRFLSICWVVLGHCYAASLLRPLVNFVEIREWCDSWTAVYILTAPFAVDTFFVISGFLMTYLFFKSKESGKKTNFLMMYLHRYLRLTPCLAALMMFVVFLLHRVANGLARDTLISMAVNPCRENWWVNFFYLQNFVKTDTMCVGHSWYLAVDMQLFWISPIILYPLHRWPKYGLGVLGLFLVTSVITPAIVLAVNGYSNALVRLDFGMERIVRGFSKYYIPTYNRACAYFVGILLGYDVLNKKRHLSKVNVAINWLVASILLLFCGWATHLIYNSDFAYNLPLETMFAILLRPSWSIGIAWIVYACTQGYGGVVTRFLSLPLFLPLGRLSYCIYLVHLVFQVVRNAGAQNPGIFLDFEMINDFWGDMALSIMIAFVFSLFFESPVIVLEKILTNRGRKPERAEQETNKDLEMEIHVEAITQQ